ncbi:MAG TPA: SRPBCC family protein [Candidatus Baltobacteraceae bacterium]|nr:SRPBCC family protein [Candidatus Baltobacteraceae bacterium]
MTVYELAELDHPDWSQALIGSHHLAVPASAVFDLISEVEKWPVWFSLLTSVRIAEPGLRLDLGTELLIRSRIPGEDEQIFEVDQYRKDRLLSLVGAYSLRRRIEFRIEPRDEFSSLQIRLDYPVYGGVVGQFFDQLTARRRLTAQLKDSLIHFTGLVEYNEHSDGSLRDL